MIKKCGVCTNNYRANKLFCSSCGKVQKIKLEGVSSICSLFDIEVNCLIDLIDKDKLEEKYADLIKLMHPDRFINATADERLIAENNTSTINKAYAILSSEIELYEYILNEVKNLNNEALLENNDEFLIEKISLHEELEDIKSLDSCISFQQKLYKLYNERLSKIKQNIIEQSWNDASKELSKLKFVKNLIKIIENKAYMLEVEEKILKK